MMETVSSCHSPGCIEFKVMSNYNGKTHEIKLALPEAKLL